jgi:CHAD domain-containing protein
MAPARPIKDLSCEESFRTAAGKILWSRFEEMMSSRDVALAGEDIEGVHDMRVGSRRLRAALEQFQDVFPKRRFRPMLRSVKILADALGEVRDLDVLIDRLQSDMKGRPRAQRVVLSDMISDMEAAREQARQRLHHVLDSLDADNFARRFLSAVAVETM